MAQAQVQAGDVISGTVSDDIEPLMMVNVVEIDNNKRIVAHGVTDVNGNFSFRCVNPKDHIQVSYIGYKTQSLPINRKVFNIKMQSATQIQPVVVQAVKKSEGPGLSIPITEISTAQQTIDMKEFEGLAMTSVDEALQGRVAGLDIVMNSGNLGAGSTMRLRGVSTITGDAEPLIVVNNNASDLKIDMSMKDDYDEERFAELLQVNPEDIESITVLKDAAATAIWGSRGANGVIMIKTKRGERGKTRVGYNYRFSGTWQPKGKNLLNGDDYTMYMKEALFNPELDNSFGDNTSANYAAEINYDPNYSQYHMFNNNTDWESAVKQFGQNHQHYVSLSGGGDKARFRVAGGYDHQIGTIINQRLNRYTTRVALDYYVSTKIQVQTNFSLSYTHNKRTYGGDNPLGQAYQKMPNVSIYEEDENENPLENYYIMQREFTSPKLQSQLGIQNIVASANMGKRISSNLNLNPEFIFRYDILGTEADTHRLRYEGQVGFSVASSDSHSFAPSYLQNDGWTGGSANSASTSQSKSNNFTTRHSLTFTPAMHNKDHSLNFMIRGQYGTGNSSSQSVSTKWLPTGDITSALAGGVLSSASGNVSAPSKSENFAFQGHYSYHGTYSFTFTARFDKSNGNPKKWGAYYGISGRWNISDEKFMKEKAKWVNMLSLSLGWGRSGRPTGGSTSMYSTYSSDGKYLGITAIAPQQIRLKIIRPANQDTWNLGSHFAFFRNKISGDVQVYTNQSEQVSSYPIPTSAGFSNIPAKLQGKVRNNGWEFNLSANNFIQRGNFRANFNMSFSNNRNEILEMDAMILDNYNKEFNHDNGQYLGRVQLHNPIGSIYGFRYKGVYAYSEYSAVEIPGVSGPDAPVARNAAGEVILNENGRTKPMMFDYAGINYEFKGGDAKYEDINNDGNINELDLVYLGSSLPKLTGGFGFSFNFGPQWSVSMRFNYRIGQKVVNGARMRTENMYDANNQSRAVNWRWHNEGDTQESIGGHILPRALFDYGYNWLGSDRFMEDATFLRMNNIVVNYNLRSKVLTQFGIKNLGANFNLQNVFVLTKYSGVDPEVPQGGYSPAQDNGRTPRSKNFTFGVNISF